ncbi:MAG: CPBP family intramembrane metalloprotease [Bacteroidota bacterium]|nr:CPBP family intramembrane metalloprotease [Bacteroidota bacterium]
MVTLISIFAAIIGNLVLSRIYNSKQIGILFQNSQNRNIPLTSIFLFHKIAGFIILGLIPGFFVFAVFPQNAALFELSIGHIKEYWYLLGLPVLIVFINYFLANNPAIFNRYPEMRFSEWTKTKLAVSVFGWTIYLLGYEFLFRGLLFFSVYRSFGLLVSLAVNVIIYSAVHISKGKSEMIAAVPFGILLCYISLLTESFILPFVIHLSLALSTDFFSIHHNPEMKLVHS